MGDATLTIEGLTTTVRIGARDVPAVSDVSFSIKKGAALGLVGESGCGKSLTALSIVRLLDPPARLAGGAIRFDGLDLATASERALRAVRGARIAMVFQEPSAALDPVMTVGDQIAEPLRTHQRIDKAAARVAVVRLLQEVGIADPDESARAYPHQLSGGMKQRAAIAMALACGPELLIADEPTTALDVTVQAQILALLARLRRDRDMALLLITHDLGIVAETCDDVAVMYAGRIVEQGPAAALFAAPRHPYTAGLLAAMRTLEASDAGAAGARRLHVIPGSVPELGQRAAGCAFADRCARAEGKCRVGVPSISETGSGTTARCWFPHEAPGVADARERQA